MAHGLDVAAGTVLSLRTRGHRRSEDLCPIAFASDDLAIKIQQILAMTLPQNMLSLVSTPVAGVLGGVGSRAVDVAFCSSCCVTCSDT